MIYVMNQKFLKKNVEKMAKHNPYFILDGENFAVTGRSNDSVAIATKFNRAHSVGGFCPEVKLYGMLRKLKRGDEINEDKFEKEIKKFIKDKSFIVAINVAFKALVAGGESEPLNIFIVLPNIVYKYLGKKIIKKMIKVADVDFEFIHSQDVLEGDFKILRKLLSPKQMKEIDQLSKKIEKKFDLKFLQDDDEY